MICTFDYIKQVAADLLEDSIGTFDIGGSIIRRSEETQ